MQIFVAFKEKVLLVACVLVVLVSLYYTVLYYDDYNDAVAQKFSELIRKRDDDKANFEKFCMSNVNVIHSRMSRQCEEWQDGVVDMRDGKVRALAEKYVSKEFYHGLRGRGILVWGCVVGGSAAVIGFVLFGRVLDLQKNVKRNKNNLPQQKKEH